MPCDRCKVTVSYPLDETSRRESKRSLTQVGLPESSEQIVLATTVDRADDVLADFAASAGIACFRGSEEDVMGRVIGAAESVGADAIVEITADCPIIDPDIIEQTIRICRTNGYKFVSNSLPDLGFPDGMDSNVVTVADLKRSYALTESALDREHVIRHIIANPDLFPRIGLAAPPDMYWPRLGLTLDEPRDYDLRNGSVRVFRGQEPPLRLPRGPGLAERRAPGVAGHQSRRDAEADDVKRFTAAVVGLETSARASITTAIRRARS